MVMFGAAVDFADSSVVGLVFAVCDGVARYKTARAIRVLEDRLSPVIWGHDCVSWAVFQAVLDLVAFFPEYFAAWALKSTTGSFPCLFASVAFRHPGGIGVDLWNDGSVSEVLLELVAVPLHVAFLLAVIAEK